MQDPNLDETRASARLPHLDIDIVHRRSRTGDAELLTISLQATPSFQAVERFLETANPFRFWLRAAELAWQPWLQAMRPMAAPAAEPPRRGVPRLPGPRAGKPR